MQLMDLRQRRILLASIIELRETIITAELLGQDNLLAGLKPLLIERTRRLDTGHLHTKPSNPGVAEDSE